MKNLFTLVLTFATVAFIAGCANNPPVATPLEDHSVPGLTIIYGSEPLAGAVGFINAKVYKDGNLERLSGSVKNLTQTAFTIEYQVIWQDINGSPLPNASPWNRFTLNPRAQKPITSIAKGVDGKTAILTFKVPMDVQIFVPEPDPVEVMNYQQELLRRTQNQ